MSATVVKDSPAIGEPAAKSKTRLSSRSLLLHSAVVVVFTALLLAVYHVMYFQGIRSSDGANYATIARNIAEGKGLISSVIQPGLMTVVPSTRDGQAFVIQAPLWPIVLGYWFKLFGVSTLALEALAGLLFTIGVVECWWLGYLLSKRVAAAYVAVALLASNPLIIGHIMAGSNVVLQGAIIGALFILMYCRLRWWTVLLSGILLGLGSVTRENTAFLGAGLALCWLLQLRKKRPGKYWLPAPRALATGAVCVVIVALLAWVPVSIEASRKAHAIGRADAPVMRLTALYETPAIDTGWYFIYDSPALQVNPVDYFREHPDQLLKKVIFQIRVAFIQQTVPALLSYTPLFIPVLLPWSLRSIRARAIGYALLLVLAIQVVVSSLSILNYIYFIAFLPVICALVAASVAALVAGAFAGFRKGWMWPLRIVLAAYGLLPIVVNAYHMGRGEPVLTGDYQTFLTPDQEARLTNFIRSNTTSGSTIVMAFSPLMAWDTERTIIQYTSAPRYRPGPGEMWQRIDQQVPIDHVLFTSLIFEDESAPMLPGFHLESTLA
ncbi:MAG TPA: hypothetical protein VF157_10145, partial [Chloroflexota bacterium]